MTQQARNEAGAALLSVLLMVAVMSIVALAMMETTIGAIQVAKAADARSDAQWQIRGAEQAGLIGAQRLFDTTEGELNLETPGLNSDFLLDTNGTEVLIRIEEGGNCFNLNSLLAIAAEGETEARTERNYRILLTSAGFRADEVDALTDALIDWIDEDNTRRPSGAEDGYYSNLRPPYRSSGVLLAELSELRAVRGYTKEIVDRLEGLVCTLPITETGTLNINTLLPEQAFLLSMAMSGELSVTDAADLLATRPIGGWPSAESLLSDARIERISPDVRQTGLLSTRSQYLTLRGEVLNGIQTSEFSTLYELTQSEPARIVSRSIGRAQ